MQIVKIEQDEGHYKIIDLKELVTSEIQIADLTQGSAKNQYGVHNFSSIEIIDDVNDKPLEFYAHLGDKKYRFVPKKLKSAAQQVFMTTEILGIPAYPIAMNNFIEKRKNKFFVTRKMTYYTIISAPSGLIGLLGKQTEEKPQEEENEKTKEELMYVHVLMYVFGIPNNSELESTSIGVVPKNFGGGECKLSLKEPIPIEKIKNIPNLYKLSPQNYINHCEVMTLISIMGFY